MDALLRKRDTLERKLEALKHKEIERIKHKDDLMERITLDKNRLAVARESLESVKSILLERKKKFMLLRNEVREYKRSKTDEIRLRFESIYNKTLEGIFSAHPSTSISTFCEFTRIRDMIDENVFKNLGRCLRRFYSEEKEKLKKYIVSQVRNRLQDKKKIHEMIFYIKFLCRYEKYFEEDVMADFLYEELSKGFEYHFMSNKESNRLDKPEWFLDFILQKLNEDREVFEIYLEMRRKGEINDAGVSEGVAGTGFEDLIARVCGLVEMKMTELVESNSRQRRKLLLHFGSQVMRFQRELFSSYGVALDFSGLGSILYRAQKEHVQRVLSMVHEKKYMTWFDGYKGLSKECLFYIYRFRSLDPEFKMDDVIGSIIEYNTVFLESLRYINRQEIRALCFLYSGFEEYKTFLTDCENEIIFDIKLTVDPMPTVVRAFPDGGGAHQSISYDAVLGSLERVSSFNNENLRLIISLATNDTNTALRAIKRFLYSPNEASRKFIVEISRFLEDYKECVSYRAIEQIVKEKIDVFLLEDVLLRYKLDTEQYFELVAFLRGLKDLFGDDEWKSDVALKCVGNIFEGMEASGSLFKLIKELYE